MRHNRPNLIGVLDAYSIDKPEHNRSTDIIETREKEKTENVR